jgi:hypothetical protein
MKPGASPPTTSSAAVPPLPPLPPRRPSSRRLSPEEELEVLIRARYPIIYVSSWEEERVERRLAQIAAARGKKFHVWTYTQGIVRYGAEPQRTKSATGSTTDPLAALDAGV